MPETKMERYYLRQEPTPDADALCLVRACYQPGEDKGAYSQGRGYTSYRTAPLPVCVTRMCHGCPPGPVEPETRHSRRPVPTGDWAAGLAALRDRIATAATPSARGGALKLLRAAHREIERRYLPKDQAHLAEAVRAALVRLELARSRRPEALAALAALHDQLASLLPLEAGEEVPRG